MNKYILFFLLIFCNSMNFSFAQTNNWCGTIENLKRELQQNPQLQEQYNEMQNFLNQQDVSGAERSAQINSNTIYIPVVFHIIHNGDAVGAGENITDAQCISQLDAMNLHYTAQDPNLVKIPSVFEPLVGDVNVQFCLAKFDPTGNPTTGIERLQYSNVSWDDQSDIDNTLKPATIWDRSKYLNIWSVRFGGTLSSGGVLAYSSLPFFGSATKDGVVARYNTIGTTGTLLAGHNLGKTVTHEVGHWLGLLHIWGDDEGKCAGEQGAGSDYVNDTPDQGDMNFGCPTFPHISCNNGPNGDLFMNYMDYTDDACSYMFTKGQVNNIHNSINQFRSGIKTASTKCFYNLDASVYEITFPKDTVCSFVFRPVVTIKNEGMTTITSGKFYYQIDGEQVQILNWSGSIPSQETEQVTLPLQQVYADDVHAIYVTFTNVNGEQNDNNSMNDSRNLSFYVHNGNDYGNPIPVTEDFEGAFPVADWSVFNPNNDAIKWEKTTMAGGYGASSNCVMLNNTAYGANPNKKKDAFLTDSYDFSNVEYPELRLDVAYSPYSATRTDSLNIYYSLNCGSTWIKIWNQSGSDLATAPEQTTLFTPTPTQWKTVSVPALNLYGQNKVSFKFENISGWGNAMYIDNINIKNNPGLTVQEITKVDIQLFPNPAKTLVGVRLPFNHFFKQLQVFNTLGEMVYQTPVTENSIIFSVEKYNSGLYLLHFSGNGISQTEKLLIQK